MIRAYTRENKYLHALEMYKIMLRKKVEPDKYTFTFVLKACAGCKDLDNGIWIHRDIVEKGLELDVYIGTSLVDMYCKLGDLDSAKQVFDKMPDRDLVASNAMIAGLAEGLDPLKAIDLFFEMQLKSKVRPNSVSLLNLFPAITKLKDIKLCKVLHGYITRRDFSQPVSNGLIDVYSKCGYIDTARQVFDQMLIRDDVSWGTITAGYSHNGYFTCVLELFDIMKKDNMKINKVCITSALLAAAELRDLEKGKEIHDCATEQGIDQDILVSTPLMTMYAKFGEINKAKKLFMGLGKRDVVAWSAAISVFSQSGYFEEALFLFREMLKNNLNPNRVTLVSILPVCGELIYVRLGKSIHCYAIKYNSDSDISTGRGLVSFYAKCQLFNLAMKIFRRLPQRDIVTWNTLISGYAKSSSPFCSIEMFSQLRLSGIQPDSTTMVCVLSAYALEGDLKQGKCIYGLIFKSGFELDCNVKNTLIDMYAKCDCLSLAESLFNETEFTKDEVSWNIMIAAYTKKGLAKKAISAFSQMRLETYCPNLITIISVLPAIAYTSDVKEGMNVHSYVICTGFNFYTLVGNSLIDMYAKCGNIEYSERIFKEMKNRDLISWNSLLTGYAIQGEGNLAVSFFSFMIQNHMEVDSVSFLCVLSACRHTGLVDEGKKLFSLMVEGYAIEPNLEHYACMVDLYGRDGLFDKALNLINKMSMEPDGRVWGALLRACRMHSNVRVGELALDKLVKLEPENPAHYMVSSGLFSQSDRWVDAKNMRLKMSEMGLKKTPGYSWL